LPGTSGILSPFGKIEGLYFNNSKEPDDFTYEFKKDLSEILEDEDVEYIQINADNKQDYYKILDEMLHFNKNAIKISGTSREEYTILVEKTEDPDDCNSSENEMKGK
jgi:hypothetical protein